MSSARPDERAVRLERRAMLAGSGVPPYPTRAERTHTANAVVVDFDQLLKQAASVTLAGRLRSLRRHGGSTFADLEDASGRLQLYLTLDDLKESYRNLVDRLDVGDIVEARGTAYRTQRGEPSLRVNRLRILAKALRPLPDKWHGLTDVEARYRNRAVDLLANPVVRETAAKRSKTLAVIRQFFLDRDYLEVETPILQPLPGGANARPFITHHEALGADLYLRIAPELYLKRLLVGGLERVFEISRCFRNEGIDRMHNPEFTQIEAYEAYADYESYMTLTEALFTKLFTSVNGSLTLESAGRSIDFSPPFRRMTFADALAEFAKLTPEDIDSDEKLKKAAKSRKVNVERGWGRGRILDELFRELVRPNLMAPTFLLDHPVELSPLAKRKPDNPEVVERFQLIAGGIELVNAFSELNDPIDQRERFEHQEALRRTGDREAQPIDEDYLTALEYGMPPAAGLGLGVDRLVALLTNQPNLKEVILFPTLKPKERGRGV